MHLCPRPGPHAKKELSAYQISAPRSTLIHHRHEHQQMTVTVHKPTLAERLTQAIQQQQANEKVFPSLSAQKTNRCLCQLGQLGKKAGERAACVKREWRDVVGTAKALGMYDSKVLSVAAGAGINIGFTVFC